MTAAPFIKIFQMMALSALLLLAISGCSGDKTSESSTNIIAADSLIPDQVTSDARMFLYSGGHRTTDLQAEEIIQFTKRDSTIATNLDVIFFDSLGNRLSTLKADQGYIRERDNFLTVSGRVLVIGEDSVEVKTEYLEWDAAKGKVTTDSFVTVIRDQDTLRSIGMITDPSLKNIIFKKQVSGRLTDIESINDEE